MSTASSGLQTPLRKALLYEAGSEPGTYVLEIPSSVCFGVVALGGFIVSFIHKAAVDFVSTIPKPHHHVRQTSVQFFRPVLPNLKTAHLKVSVANGSKLWTTVKVDVLQNNKVCVTGFMTLQDLLRPGEISAKTNWALSPPPPPVLSLQALGADEEPGWVSYTLPFRPKNFRRPQAYMRFFYPVVKHPNNNFIDQWVTPAWKDDEAPGGAVWTNELVHFALDNVVPLLNDLADTRDQPTLYKYTIKAGSEQLRARSEGRDDRIVGEGLSDNQLFPYIMSTISMSTEIFKPIPAEGTKWIFMRALTKCVQNDRIDYDVYMLDQENDLLASSQQTMHIVPFQVKMAKAVL